MYVGPGPIGGAETRCKAYAAEGVFLPEWKQHLVLGVHHYSSLVTALAGVGLCRVPWWSTSVNLIDFSTDTVCSPFKGSSMFVSRVA